MTPELAVLLEDEVNERPGQPLLDAYGGPLRVRGPGPRLVANFVTTVDGLVSLGPDAGEGAGAVGLGSAADRFVMALLRSSADALLIGAGTLRRDPHHQWTARTIFPELAAELAEFRHELTGSAQPAPLVVVSGSGELPPAHPALTSPETDVLVVTSEPGRRRLPALGPRVRVAIAGGEAQLQPVRLLETIRAELAAGTLLAEAGPSLFAQLLGAGLVDELFLTVSPQLAGAGGDRLSLLGEARFAPGGTPRLRLRSVRRAGQHLLLRYAVAAAAAVAGAEPASPRRA